MESAFIEKICDTCKINFWEWDIHSNSFNVQGYFDFLSKPSTNLNRTLEDFIKNVYQNDRFIIEEAFNQYRQKQQPIEIEFRIPFENDLKWIYFKSLLLSNTTHAAGILLENNAQNNKLDINFNNQIELMRFKKLYSSNVMISKISHELCQPLSIINTYMAGCINRIKDNMIDKKRLLEIMEKITKQTTYLGNKIHQIKDYLQLDKNSDNRYHIHEVINKSLRFLDNELQHSKILVELIFDDNISTSNMDIVHMMQVLNFLIKTCIQSLKNCIEPHLKITTNKIKTNLYSITITDNSSNSTTRTVSNLLATPADETIDLIICKNIIEAHGGILLSQASSSGNNIQFTLQE